MTYTPILSIDGIDDLTSNSDICALASISISWGTTSVDTQPDPSVMSVTLLDRTGSTVRDSANLSGRAITLKHSVPGGVPGATVTVWRGIISAGATVTRTRAGWRIALTATGTMVIWKRLRDEGPVDTSDRADAMNLIGYVWTGLPDARVQEMNNRAERAGGPQWRPGTLPTVTRKGVTYAVQSPVEKGSLPSQYTIMHMMGEDGTLPLWYERFATHTIGALRRAGSRAEIGMDAAANLCSKVTGGVMTRALDAGSVQADDSFELPTPYAGVVFQTKRLESRYESLGPNAGYEITWQQSDAQTSVEGSDLPASIADNSRNLIIETDLITDGFYFADTEPHNTFGYEKWSMLSSAKNQIRALLRAIANTAVPHVVFDSDQLDGNAYYALFHPEPPVNPLCFQGCDSAGINLTGPFMVIGGELTIDMRDGEPHLRHDVTLMPAAMSIGTAALTWQGIPSSWTTTYAQAAASTATLDDLGRAQWFSTSTAATFIQ